MDSGEGAFDPNAVVSSESRCCYDEVDVYMDGMRWMDGDGARSKMAVERE